MSSALNAVARAFMLSTSSSASSVLIAAAFPDDLLQQRNQRRGGTHERRQKRHDLVLGYRDRRVPLLLSPLLLHDQPVPLRAQPDDRRFLLINDPLHRRARPHPPKKDRQHQQPEDAVVEPRGDLVGQAGAAG